MGACQELRKVPAPSRPTEHHHWVSPEAEGACEFCSPAVDDQVLVQNELCVVGVLT